MYVEFPDAEVAVVKYLQQYMPDVLIDVEGPPVYRGDRGIFVRVTRVGGTPTFPVTDRPLMDIDVWGPSRWTAVAALQAVLGHLAVATHRPAVGGALGSLSVITGPQYLEDPQTKEPRWQALIQIGVRSKRA